MKVIKTIDLWTEQKDNHYECFNGAFVDGFENCGGGGFRLTALRLSKIATAR